MEQEIWKQIENYPNYEISNYGRVKSKERISNCCYNSKRKVKSRILKQSLNNNGYYTVCLFKNGKHTKLIHQLVAEAFILNKNNYKCINHKDGNKQNNVCSNLEYCTHSYNTSESYRLGLQKPSEHQKEVVAEYCRKHKIKSIIQLDLKNNFIKEWKSAVQVEKELNFNRKSISNCLKGKSKTANGYIWKYKEQFENNCYILQGEEVK